MTSEELYEVFRGREQFFQQFIMPSGDHEQRALMLAAMATLQADFEAWIRERIACDIEAVAFGSLLGVVDRPKVERGGFLNDWEWAQQVVRDGLPDGVARVVEIPKEES